jgi:hypothetical protein
MLPLALAVSFSRVYCGVHFPSDVMAGAILGAGTAAASLWLATELWIFIGRRWFPLWWKQFPVLIAPPQPSEAEDDDAEEPRFAPRLKPGQKPSTETLAPRHVTVDQQWLRLGYFLIAVLLVTRLLYIASDVIQLSPEEAAHWFRSQHLANLQLSDSPLAVLLIWAGTLVSGDRPFGVRLFAPLLSAATGLILLRLFTRATNTRAGFFSILFLTAAPMLAAGGIVLTPNFLRAFFWTACLVCGWRALQAQNPAGWWILTGVCAGLVSLSKQPALFPLASFLFLFVLLPAARRQLKTAGPWITFLFAATPIAASVLSPNLFHFRPASGAANPESALIRLAALLLLNPFWVIFGAWAAIVFWRRHRHNPFLIYCFSMSVPALAFALAFDPDWDSVAAPGIGLICLMTAYWDIQWRLQSARLKPWLTAGLVPGLAVTLLCHETNWVEKLAGRPLPVSIDPLGPVRGWRETALAVQRMQHEVAKEGQPVFIISESLGLAGELSFYLRDGKADPNENPLVYVYSQTNANTEADGARLRSDYLALKGEDALFVLQKIEESEPPPAILAGLRQQFGSLTDLGVKDISYHAQVLRRLQFFACHKLE